MAAPPPPPPPEVVVPPLVAGDVAGIEGVGNGVPVDELDGVVASDELSGLLSTTREVESPGRTASARMPLLTSGPTWNVKVESLTDALACCLQSYSGASSSGPPCSVRRPGLSNGHTSSVATGVVALLGATLSVSSEAVRPSASS